MHIDWRAIRKGCLKWLKTGWLVLAVLLAVHSGVFRPMQAFRGIAMEGTAGLAAIEDTRHWLVPLPESVDNATLAAGLSGESQEELRRERSGVCFRRASPARPTTGN